MNRQTLLLLLGWLMIHSAGGAELGTLYNGIPLPVLPTPRPAEVPQKEEMPGYLRRPPQVIPIDVGRQLFVDDFLIEETTLGRTCHRARYHEACPVLRPETPWEMAGRGPMAMPFSGGVWWDTQDQRFKMWYAAGYSNGIALAYSADGVRWERPSLDVKPGTNLVFPTRGDTTTVWIDSNEKDPARRYKLFMSRSGGSTVQGEYGYATHFSADGIHWSEKPVLTGACGDRSTVFYNPFRNVWVYSLRHGWGQPRRRRYFETNDVVNGSQWGKLSNATDGSVPWKWVGADERDAKRPELGVPPQLYNLDCAPYESLLLGFFTIWRGDPRKSDTPEARAMAEQGRPKLNEVCIGYSRDGYQWWRPDRAAFHPLSEKRGDWNWGNVQSAAGGCVVVGDRLYFYVSGRAGKSLPGCNDHDAGGSTGLAVLRRDGFASMDAAAGQEGTLTTRPVQFRGRRLFVNTDAAQGAVRAEVLDEKGDAIAPFSLGNCEPVSSADTTLAEIRWRGAADLATVAGRPVRFRFHVRGARLYAFWVSPDQSGASHGYVAAGGPGYNGPVDTLGRAALEKAGTFLQTK
ncbi:MAG: glycosyl hydrolase family 32 [Prosthecobacter sp.]